MRTNRSLSERRNLTSNPKLWACNKPICPRCVAISAGFACPWFQMVPKLPVAQALETIFAPDGVALLRSSGLDRRSKRLAARRALELRGPAEYCSDRGQRESRRSS